MSFENTERIAAVSPAAIASLYPALLAQFGEELPDGKRTIRTIGGHWDDGAKTRKRAASMTDGTITGTTLTDGRIAFRCLWQSDLVAAWDNGDLSGFAELTSDEYQALLPEAISMAQGGRGGA